MSDLTTLVTETTEMVTKAKAMRLELTELIEQIHVNQRELHEEHGINLEFDGLEIETPPKRIPAVIPAGVVVEDDPEEDNAEEETVTPPPNVDTRTSAQIRADSMIKQTNEEQERSGQDLGQRLSKVVTDSFKNAPENGVTTFGVSK